MNIKKLIPKISEEEMTPLVIRLLEINQLLMEEVQELKDEIARLKGQAKSPGQKSSPQVLQKKITISKKVVRGTQAGPEEQRQKALEFTKT